MIPKTEIIYNYNYAKRLYRGQGIFEDVWRRILGLGADLEIIFSEYSGYIMESVERYSGFFWEEFNDAELPVYLVDSAPSFSNPMTVTVDEDPVVMLKDYITQLAHRNMSFGFKTDELRAKCVKLITDRIMVDLKLENPEKNEWDVSKQPIKKYLNK